MEVQKKGLGYYVKEGIKRCFNLLITTWLIIGSTLLLILFLELACIFYHKITFQPRERNYFKLTDSYNQTPWIDDYYQEIDASYVTSWKSYVYWRRNPFRGKHINIDQQGIRRTAPSALSDAAALFKLRIFMFGGSTMWGEGVRDRYTLPSLMVQELDAHKIKAEITNFGEVAYVTTQELIDLIFQLERGNIPDMVVFFDGWNDVYSAQLNKAAGLPQNERNRALEFNLTKYYPNLRKVFLEKSLDQFCLGKTLKSLAPSSRRPKGPLQDFAALADDLVKIYLSNLKIITALGKAYGFTPVFYWQPVIYNKKNLTEFEKKYREARLGELYDQTNALISKNKSKFADYHFYNLVDLFSETKGPVYIDYCHVNEAANQAIASRIAQDLVPLIRERHLAASGHNLAAPGKK
jgi:lysophospholipase L1-like esterase